VIVGLPSIQSGRLLEAWFFLLQPSAAIPKLVPIVVGLFATVPLLGTVLGVA
jgi:hypothetical protein